MAAKKIALRNVADCVKALEEFNCNGTLTGNDNTVGIGRLSGEDRDMWNVDNNGEGIIYVVRSYATPIAWVTKSGEIRIPATRYSVTTSKHQGQVRMGFAMGENN